MKTTIEKGNKLRKEDIVYVKKCSNCGSKFTYQKEDKLWDMLWEQSYVRCTECNELLPIWIDHKYKGK